MFALVFVSTDAQVKGQIGGDDPLFTQNDTSTEAVITGDSPVPGGPGFIMVSPFEFKPYSTSYEWGFLGKSVYNPGLSYSHMVAGLNLPDGATITKLTLFYKDNVASDLTLYLFRGSMDNTEYQMAHVLSEDWDTTYRFVSTTSISDPVVNNQVFSYFLYVYFPGNVGQNVLLTNVRIDYGYTTVAPLIMG